MPVFYRQIRSMGTILDIVVPELEDARGVELISRVSQLLHDLESTISNYDADSELSKMNKLAFSEEVGVSEELRFFLESGISFFRKTEGYFDFTLGAITSVPNLAKHFRSRLNDFLNIPLEERISINKDYVKFLDKDVCIDSGGLGKGFAILKLEKLLNDLNIPSAFISFGGSSVLGKGKHPHGEYWKLGVQHPWKNEESLGELELHDSSVSISGNSLNNSEKYKSGHVLDSVRGDFYTGKDIVSVVGKDHLAVEAVSTAMVASGEKFDKELKSRFPELEMKRYRIN